MTILRALAGRRKGVVGVWVAIALLALLGMAALVIDIGRVSIAAQQVQAIVDAAALAGAAKLPAQSDAEASLQRTISANNLLNTAWVVSCVPSNDVVYYGPGETVPEYGALEDDEDAITITGRAVVDYSFARIFGVNNATVTRSATAKAGGSIGRGLLFAGEANPNIEGIRFNGSGVTVEGTMHSNCKIKMTGVGHHITDDVKYRFWHNIDPDYVDGRIIETVVKPYPLDYTWEQFDVGPWDHIVNGNWTVKDASALMPGRWKINGSLNVSANNIYLHDMLIVATGDIDFKKADLERVTLVAGGGIELQKSEYSALEGDLFAMALGTGNPAIKMSGNGSVTTGRIFAPNGGIEYDGADQEMHRGALVALTIVANGAGGLFQGLGDGGSGGPPEIELIKYDNGTLHRRAGSPTTINGNDDGQTCTRDSTIRSHTSQQH